MSVIQQAKPGTQTNLVLTGDRAVIVWTLDTKKTYMAISRGPQFTFDLSGLPSGTYKLKTVQNGHITISQTQVTDGTYVLDVPAHGMKILETL